MGIRGAGVAGPREKRAEVGRAGLASQEVDMKGTSSRVA